MLATETGVWATINLNASTPFWEPINEGMANVRVDMLSYRESDRTVLAATHGRGFFTTTWDVVTGVNSFQLSAFGCYPNPTNGLFNIMLNSKEVQTIEIAVFNQEGKNVYQGEVSTPLGAYSKTVDLSEQPAGIYFLKITENGKVSHTKKIIRL